MMLLPAAVMPRSLRARSYGFMRKELRVPCCLQMHPIISFQDPPPWQLPLRSSRIPSGGKADVSLAVRTSCPSIQKLVTAANRTYPKPRDWHGQRMNWRGQRMNLVVSCQEGAFSPAIRDFPPPAAHYPSPSPGNRTYHSSSELAFSKPKFLTHSSQWTAV